MDIFGVVEAVGHSNFGRALQSVFNTALTLADSVASNVLIKTPN
jgi:hypothetical protein